MGRNTDILIQKQTKRLTVLSIEGSMFSRYTENMVYVSAEKHCKSDALWNIAMYVNTKNNNLDALNGFSDDLIEAVKMISRR